MLLFDSKPFSGNLFLKERKIVSQNVLVDLSYILYIEELQANIILMLVAEKNAHNQCIGVFHVHKTTLLIPPI